MAASLSAYWVKFFKGAGFPLDVATKHAVVFSNNRIKPDMLPDLDKPSLKDMGITLMGDMIAILRYAKKVVEETTCERFLVDTEDDKSKNLTKPLTTTRTILKKVVNKLPNKMSATKPKIIQETIETNVKPEVKSSTNNLTKTSAKKKIITKTLRSDTNESKKIIATKRKSTGETSESDSDDDDDDDEDNEKEWIEEGKKRLKLSKDDDKVGYTVIMPKGRTIRSQEILKKISEQKRTVFDRLGDSSVTSTTNFAEVNMPTFNITGLGNDVLKRNSSVFNRLGDKDATKKIDKTHTGILKNGNANSSSLVVPPGILKTPKILAGTSNIVGFKQNVGKTIVKPTGTMRADHEKNLKTASSSVRQLVRTTKKIRLGDQTAVPKFTTKVIRKIDNSTSKLASERIATVPAKARLGLTGSGGTTKQVTFDRVTKIARIKKPGVFSRLGI